MDKGLAKDIGCVPGISHPTFGHSGTLLQANMQPQKWPYKVYICFNSGVQYRGFHANFGQGLEVFLIVHAWTGP